VKVTSDPKAGQKLRASIDSLATEYSRTTAGKGAALVDAFLPDEMAAEMIQDIMGDVIFRFLLASATYIRSISSSESFDASLDRFILKKTRLTGDLAKRLRQNLKQAVFASEEERPKNERRSRMKNKQQSRNCYLCSGAIDDDAILDHVWPRSAGGGNGKSNLRIAHAFCEAVKADFAVSGDAPIGRFAFQSLPRTLMDEKPKWWPLSISTDIEFRSLLDDVRGSQLKLAVLSRQEFQCHKCGKPFFNSKAISVVRRNHDEPWWFANVVAVCEECEKS
jgi:5-methylcytosine-specific restriction endonuclease McrA